MSFDPGALADAVVGGDTEGILRELRKPDADVNADLRPPERHTALHMALLHGQAASVRALCSGGQQERVDPNLQDDQGHWTPLHLA